MRASFAITIAAWSLCAVLSNETPSEPRMSLTERIANSTLIVVGKLGAPGNTGKHTTTSVRVEEVIFGSIPANNTLFVSYSGTGWLIPEIFSRTEQPKRGSRWLFFLTNKGVIQSETTNYFTRAVGPHQYAHDGLELAKEETLRQVRQFISQNHK